MSAGPVRFLNLLSLFCVRSGLMKSVLYVSSVLFQISFALISTFFLTFILVMTARIIQGLV